jgi:tetratricopeptide (TPR) repeat protein
MATERRTYRGLAAAALLALALVGGPGCMTFVARVNPALEAAAGTGDALAVYDALESLIEARQDTPGDRTFAYDELGRIDENSAAATYARAGVTGRLVQQRGLRAAHLVPEIEHYAERSRELDPGFRGGAATRLLGTLYVAAPATLLEDGDSERGLALLEELARTRPDVLENHLRLAEAYLALGDPDPATDHLCRCVGSREGLGRDDRELLESLLEQSGRLPCAYVDVATPPSDKP